MAHGGPSPSVTSIRLRAVGKTVLWIIFTIFLAELAPILLLWEKGADRQQSLRAVREFIGASVLLLTAWGVYCSTWADCLSSFPRSWSVLHWLGFIGVGLSMGWLTEHVLVSEFLGPKKPLDPSNLWGDENLWEQVSVCFFTLAYCTVIKVLLWREEYRNAHGV
jgi:hypothetical protein